MNRNRILVKCATLVVVLLAAYAQLNAEENLIPLVPKPNRFEVISGNEFMFNKKTVIYAHPSLNSSIEQFRELFQASGLNFALAKSARRSNVINISIDKSLDSLTNEGYIVHVTSDKIDIKSSSPAGLYYAYVSLSQLVCSDLSLEVKHIEKWSVPGVYVEDKPRFKWRGFMLDVSRQFFKPDHIMKYIDWLALHKINILHLHLTDDQGWRIEIKKYPELTIKGAWRGKNEILRPAFGSNDERYGGFYTQSQLKELIEYAAKKNISILPEIDLPGHSRAVIATYPALGCEIDSSKNIINSNVYCLTNSNSFPFIMDILKEVAALFPFEYIHIGGDEVNKRFWQNCNHCSEVLNNSFDGDAHKFQNSFIKQIELGLQHYGKKMIGWNEILDCGNHLSSTALMAWEDVSKCYLIPKCGQNVILTPKTHYYLDKRQAEDERGWVGDIITTKDVYQFNPGLDDLLNKQEQANILGIQGNLWSEKLSNPCRFDEYQTFPRLCAIAEAAWTNQELRDWNDFSERMTLFHFQRLENYGINYRLFTPEYTIMNGFLNVEAVGSSLIVRYTLDGSEPNNLSPVYKAPINVNGLQIVNIKSFTPSGYSSPTVMIRL